MPRAASELMRYLAHRADKLRQAYDPARETDMALEIRMLVTSLAATYVRKGSDLALNPIAVFLAKVSTDSAAQRDIKLRF